MCIRDRSVTLYSYLLAVAADTDIVEPITEQMSKLPAIVDDNIFLNLLVMASSVILI